MPLNADFFWDGQQPEDGEIDCPHNGNPDEPREHMAEIAEVIRR